MIRRLTKRTELEIVAQWPQDGDIGEDSSPYVASLLGDCSPDELGKMSTRAPEALMQLLKKYVPLISSQCKARGTLGAKVCSNIHNTLSSPQRSSNSSYLPRFTTLYIVVLTMSIFLLCLFAADLDL